MMLSILTTVKLNAQASDRINRCFTDELHSFKLIHEDGYKERIETIASEQADINIMPSFKAGDKITIPVVVHVVYRLDVQNISDDQIKSQIDVLNADFNKLNWDTIKVPSVFQPLMADIGFEFKLATRDPNGSPTDGITRTKTSVVDVAETNGNAYHTSALGGKDIWDRNSYLNIWVCEVADGVLGFANFPGSSAQSDGVVIHYENFGTNGTAKAPYNKGRTAVHEVAHWFNLRHLWGDSFCGSDGVSDTPTQEEANYYCPSFPSVSCSNGPNGDLFMNYMDYVDDDCMMMFTEGQKTVMQGIISGSRISLQSSNGYNSIDEELETISLMIYPIPSDGTITLEFPAPVIQETSMFVYNVTGQLVTQMTIEKGFIGKQQIEIHNPGNYVVSLKNQSGITYRKIVIR